MDDRLLVLSDLHLGPEPGGPYDFTAASPELGDAIRAAGPSCVVLNGDTFDFLEDDGPLDLARGTARLEAILRTPAGEGLLAGLRPVLAAGGTVIVRPGNHDLELHQSSVGGALERLTRDGELRGTFKVDPEPFTDVQVAGSLVRIAHGDELDDWNRVDPARAAGAVVAGTPYPPGSELVKRLLNPARARKGLHFLGVLTPDFKASLFAAVAVCPNVLELAGWEAMHATVGRRLSRLVVPYRAAQTEGAPLSAEAARQLDDAADLLLDGLEAEVARNEPDLRGPIPELPRWFRRALLQRAVAFYWRLRTMREGSPERDFVSPPDAAETRFARQLLARDGDVVCLGHTHDPRQHPLDGLGRTATYVNTGSWTRRMFIPSNDDGTDPWGRLLDDLSADPGLTGVADGYVVVMRTAAMIDRDGARLVEWKDGAWLPAVPA